MILAFATSANAHSGGTDSNGCHKNHKTGDYHCH
ncbi:YHYH domain-containing protein [Mesorhizobium sp. M0563]